MDGESERRQTEATGSDLGRFNRLISSPTIARLLRSSSCRMLKGINYWSFPGGLEGTAEVGDVLEWTAEFGFQALELCIERAGSFDLSATESQCQLIREKAKSLNIRLESVASKTYWERSLGDSNAANREGAKEDLEKMIRITGWLGAKTLLTIPGIVDSFFMPSRPSQSYEEVGANAREGLESVLPAAEKHRVRLGIENVWNKFLLSPDEMTRFIDGFASPWIGAYVDVANMLAYGYPEQWIKQLGPRVVGVHFKDYRKAVGTADGFVDLLEGDVNWPEVMAALSEIGYTGPVVAEMMPLYRHFPLVRIANTSRAMDAIMGRA